MTTALSPKTQIARVEIPDRTRPGAPQSDRSRREPCRLSNIRHSGHSGLGAGLKNRGGRAHDREPLNPSRASNEAEPPHAPYPGTWPAPLRRGLRTEDLQSFVYNIVAALRVFVGILNTTTPNRCFLQTFRPEFAGLSERSLKNRPSLALWQVCVATCDARRY